MRSFFATIVALALAGCGAPEPQAQGDVQQADTKKLWVTTQYADRHTCPSERCGIVGRLFFREGTEVHEVRDGWTRVSRVYDASCEGGRSAYVDKGRADCAADNGIEGGLFAEWIKSDQLSETRPPDPAETAAPDESLVANSDDFTQHRKAFAKAAAELIASGRCTKAEFEEMGGWIKSSNHRDAPVYFTYCGGMTVANRIYLDASSGRVF